jgi:hypothetical protein
VHQDWPANLTVVAVTLGLVALCVLVHYEGLVLTQRVISRQRRHRRVKVMEAISMLIVLHMVEIAIFGLAYWFVLLWPQNGSITPATYDLFDHLYFSAVTYTTVGYGDLAPVGPIRFMAGVESLLGLVLITWSASFTYLEMERFWKETRGR